MTDARGREALINRVEWALHRVSSTTSYHDWAAQIVDDLENVFPGAVQQAEQIVALRREVDSLRLARDSAQLQLQSHLVRCHD